MNQKQIHYSKHRYRYYRKLVIKVWTTRIILFKLKTALLKTSLQPPPLFLKTIYFLMNENTKQTAMERSQYSENRP